MDEEEFIPGTPLIDINASTDNYPIPNFDLEDYEIASTLGLESEEAIEIAVELSKDTNIFANFYREE